MSIFSKRQMPYVGPRFGHIEFEGRKIYLAGFTHGIGLIRPGKVPIDATKHLLETEKPHVLIEGKSVKFPAKILKNKELLTAEPVETELGKAVRDKQIRASFKQTFGFDPYLRLKTVSLAAAVASPLLLFSKTLNRKRQEIFRGASANEISEIGRRIHVDMRDIFRPGSDASQDRKFWHLAADFRSFLMAEAIIHRHKLLPKEKSIVLLSGIFHSKQVAAFLSDERLRRNYAEALPAPLVEIRRRVTEARLRETK